MLEKNPYENQETVDIPNFSSKSLDDTESSKFQFDDDFDEDDYESEPTYRKVKSPIIVATIVVIILLLCLSTVGLILATKNKKAYNTLKEEYDAYVARATSNESALNAKIANLQAQISQTTPTTPGGEVTTGDTYKVVVDSISVRSGANSSNDFVSFSSLPSDIQEMCEDEGENGVYILSGAVVKVSETKTDDSSRVWGKIADNAWICLKNGSDDYCKKQ